MMQKQDVTASIESIAYLEMYVGNIFHTKNFLLNAMKFTHIASKKEDDIIKFLLKQGDMYFLLVSSLRKSTPIADHLEEYGDSIKKISFWVNDVDVCYESAVAHGAKSLLSPQLCSDVRTASVDVFNNVEHEFLQKRADRKIPGFDYISSDDAHPPMLFNFDHIALCFPRDTIKNWVKFYKEAFGFSVNTNEDIHSKDSGMHIIIMKSPNGKVNLPLVEPASDKSPLHTYLKYNHGAGVHHVAFETNNIIDAVKHYERYHGELRKAPFSYYEEAKDLYPDQLANIEDLRPHGIMLEQDDKGVLFQIFTKPVVTRPTLFFEFVQRDVCEGFGTVNIKALYETLEA